MGSPSTCPSHGSRLVAYGALRTTIDAGKVPGRRPRICLAGESLDWMIGGLSVVAAISLRTSVSAYLADTSQELTIRSGPPVSASRTVLASALTGSGHGGCLFALVQPIASRRCTRRCNHCPCTPWCWMAPTREVSKPRPRHTDSRRRARMRDLDALVKAYDIHGTVPDELEDQTTHDAAAAFVHVVGADDVIDVGLASTDLVYYARSPTCFGLRRKRFGSPCLVGVVWGLGCVPVSSRPRCRPRRCPGAWCPGGSRPRGSAGSRRCARGAGRGRAPAAPGAPAPAAGGSSTAGPGRRPAAGAAAGSRRGRSWPASCGRGRRRCRPARPAAP